MRSVSLLTVLLLAAACSTASVPEPGRTEYARLALAAADAIPVEPPVVTETAPVRPASATRFPLRPDPIATIVSVGPERLAKLGALAVDEAALDRFLTGPVGRDDLAALACLRSPAVAAARARLEAVRTGYRQSDDLADLVATYRSFVRTTTTRVGPERSRKPTAAIAPYPSVSALSFEVVAKSVDIAFEELRAELLTAAATAERAHADAARLAEARRILAEQLSLEDGLLRVLRAKLESGEAGQAGYLAFSARLTNLRTEVGVLDAREAEVRAVWNRLLARPVAAPVFLDVSPEDPGFRVAPDDTAAVVARAGEVRPKSRIASLAAARAAAAVRLAETMTLPRLDVGSSRFERERAGEAGAQRGAVFPEPGRMNPPRADFGVREAQVTEMRARRDALEAARADVRDHTAAGARSALVAFDAAARRTAAREEEVVPLAERAFEAAKGAYEGGRTGYLDLLDAARGLLSARLALADAKRDLSHAGAALLLAVGERLIEGRTR